MSRPHPTATERRKGRFWALFPLVLLGAMLLGWGFMVAVALDDPGFSVEPDYYAKAIAWDEHQAQEARNEALGWQIAPELTRQAHGAMLAARLVDRTGAGLDGARVSVEAFHLARGAHVVHVVLAPRGSGRYEGVAAMRRPGIWEMRFTVERDGARFTHVTRTELLRGVR